AWCRRFVDARSFIILGRGMTQESAAQPEMRLELVPIGVADPDRAKDFYVRAGFTLGVDTSPTPGMRVIQFTPAGSASRMWFGTGMGDISDMEPGVVKAWHLVVHEI